MRTWLTSVVRNRAIDIVRARRESTGDDEPTLLAIRDPRPPVEEQVVHALDARAAATVLADLPSEQRHVIGLAFFAGHSHAEIAEATATCPSAPSRAASGWACSACAPAWAQRATPAASARIGC